MADDLDNVELDEALLADLVFLDFQQLCTETCQQTEGCGSQNPAPPHAPAEAEVNEGMADEANECTGQRAVNNCHKCQQTVLDGDVGICNRAGDGNKTTQHEEQGGTDADGNDGLNRELLHFYLPP